MLFVLQIFSHTWPSTLVYPLLNSEATPGWSWLSHLYTRPKVVAHWISNLYTRHVYLLLNGDAPPDQSLMTEPSVYHLPDAFAPRLVTQWISNLYTRHVYPLLNGDAPPDQSLMTKPSIYQTHLHHDLSHSELATCTPDKFTPCWMVMPHLGGLSSLYTQGSCSLQNLV